MLHIYRGLPGSGKSTAARKHKAPVREADNYFIRDGVYNFDPTKLGAAHLQCQNLVEDDLMKYGFAVVANTFTRYREMKPYIDMASRLWIPYEIHDIYDGGLTDEELAARNVHGVPLDVITRMRQRYWRP